MRKTQTEMVLEYIMRFGSISSLEAFEDLGVTRLAARISDIIRMGISVKKTTESRKNRFGRTVCYTRYSLEV